jgi:hypothetical protein
MSSTGLLENRFFLSVWKLEVMRISSHKPENKQRSSKDERIILGNSYSGIHPLLKNKGILLFPANDTYERRSRL